ncbi:protein TOPAZ1 isoform X3 [Brachyhypopomus gauderio]
MRFGAGRDVRRPVKNSCCALCGDVKYTPPTGKLADVQKPRSLQQVLSGGHGGSRVQPVVQAQQKARLTIWLGRYPKVKLCDVARVFDVTSRDFSCVLPLVPQQKRKRKRVHCFKREFWSLMRSSSRGDGDRGKWIASQRWEVCTPNNSCASLSSGEQRSGANGGKCPLGVEDSLQGCARTSGNYVAWTPDSKSMKPATGEELACFPSCHGRVEHCGDPGEAGGDTSGLQDTAAPACLVPPMLLRRVNPCCDFGSSRCSQGAESLDLDGETGEQLGGPESAVENWAADRDAYALDPFSCQRTRAYVMLPHYSCSRTYVSWPFPRHGPPSEMKSSVHAGPRWLESRVASPSGEVGVGGGALCCLSSTSEHTVEKKNAKSKLCNLLSLAHSRPRNLLDMETDLLGVAPKALENCQINPSKSIESDYRTLDSSRCSSIVPAPSVGTEQVHASQVKPPSPGPVETHASSAGDDCSLKVTSDQKDISCLPSVKQHDGPVMGPDEAEVVLPQDPSSTHKTKSVVLRSYTTTTTPTSSLHTRLKCGAYEAEPTVSHPSSPVLDFNFNLKTPQTHLECPKENMQTSSTTMEHSKVEPQHPSLVMVHSSINATVTNKAVSKFTPLHSRTAEPYVSPSHSRGRRSYTSLTSNDSSSSSSEDDSGSLSPGPVESDPDYLLQQDEMCEINKAKQGTSPECSVVAGGEMDVLRAYAEDAIVLDVIQDDPELFGVVTMGTEGHPSPKTDDTAVERRPTVQPLKTSPARKPRRIVWTTETESSRKVVLNGGDAKVENPEAFCTEAATGVTLGSRSRLTPTRNWPPLNAVALPEQIEVDCNNNMDKMDVDVNVNNMDNHTGATHLVMETSSSALSVAGKDTSVLRPSLTSNPHQAMYCWYYFSDTHSCLWTSCRYLHVPREDDEKFCMEAVQKFCRSGNSSVLHRAVKVVVEYYRTCSPGVSFSLNIIGSLLSSLLSLGLLSELVSVINTLLAHRRLPPPDIVMDLYEHVKERGLLCFVQELLLLTSKIVETGGRFTVDQWKMMQAQLQVLQVPKLQMDIFSAVQCRALATNPQTVELSEIAQALIQVQFYKQQENWAGIASVFHSVCEGRHSAGDLSRFCCSVTLALLKEPKDKLTLPYEPFAESVCQKLQPHGLIKSFLGRVGVSLMFTYHRRQEWTKGVKLMGVMSRLRVEFSTLKGLLASEDGASRCQLITIATEIFLNSGSIEGALNMLREDEWFVSSSMWPCRSSDVSGRRRVLSLLAERTSHRDTLEVLTNLPGLRQPIDGVQVGEYCGVFNAHLERCVMNQVLPVAADTLEFMLTQEITADTTQLHNLIHTLGRQNVWGRARTLFKRAHSAGYYDDVAYERMSLALPCSLSEIEMTLALEMFITHLGSSLQSPSDQTPPSLVITLRRGSGSTAVLESVYLAAACRLLSAAVLPNPKLAIRYTAVNQEQEQLFHLDCSSAAKWLAHNRGWAEDVWSG